MRRIILILLLLINVYYIANFLINFDSSKTLNSLWIVFFIISFCLSLFYLFRSRKNSGYNPYLLIAVLVASISSLGTFGYLYFISNLMG